MKILHLTIKRKWFELIKSGKKKTEYREIKPYWINRLVLIKNKDILSTNFIGHPYEIKKFNYIIFRNGYRKDSPKIKVKWKGMTIKEFEGKPHFAIKLGEIIK